jgi:hypothetical protein
MQIMLQISSMVLQSTTIDEVRFDDEHEMSVDDGLHGWTKDRNWWVRLMTWRRCRWTSKAWGPVVGPVLDVEGVKVGSGGGGSDAETAPDRAR